ncbi:esterase-like activity of phytase family protein [Phaeobacter gallaeciensis]|uniref:esterase-like activity of phytase family protein n=1 Tax=Phaeobacter gallaeciensis TaxID=60890 RepID=UPI0023803FBA|nr:esterase-like activity of phytase family protein [Phaeobacter gallaeciensis]MDE4274855.1 esterase-like activity of phytase family protein [Phaeobacter gallaeciensis]MDE4300228.1 esterase-like activity of phytase family protein [Phaeobacter gallaeciensis]MDE5185392.1 esterase-like activity of phytase family protein [Phaeobacter gallaeciensis]
MRRSPAIRLSLALMAAAALAVATYAGARAGRVSAEARLIGSYTWAPPVQPEKPWFGGFSGIEMGKNGRSMILLSDRAHLVRARINRTEGRITSARVTKRRSLRASTGRILQGRIVDSEGLAVAPDGSLYISFEGVSRVAHHQRGGSRAEVLPRPNAFRQMPANKALEALAIDGAGHLYTLPENAPDKDGNLPVWKWDGSEWSQPFSLPRRGRFMPVGADFGPDGRFYLLERNFLLFGFRSRLRRWDITEGGPQNETTLLQTALGTHDNLEGVSIWRDAAGVLRATMVSDDNFLSVQRTELVEYSLPD